MPMDRKFWREISRCIAPFSSCALERVRLNCSHRYRFNAEGAEELERIAEGGAFPLWLARYRTPYSTYRLRRFLTARQFTTKTRRHQGNRTPPLCLRVFVVTS